MLSLNASVNEIGTIRRIMSLKLIQMTTENPKKSGLCRWNLHCKQRPNLS